MGVSVGGNCLMLIDVKRPSTLWTVSFLDMGPGLDKSRENECSSRHVCFYPFSALYCGCD